MTRIYNIKPKPVVYRGIEFRSTLEARWAVFFNTLHLRWEYEKEPFAVDSHTWYLPDFWVKDWLIEIKPTRPDDDEIYKARSVSVEKKIAIISGNPSPMCNIWMYKDGKEMDVVLSTYEQFTCFVKGLNINQWLNLKKLSVICKKRGFERAFIKAGGYKFEQR